MPRNLERTRNGVWGQMRFPRRAVAVGLVLTALLASSVPASSIEEIENDLDDAVRTLEGIQAALDAAERDIAAAEGRLREAETALDDVAAELDQARLAVADAEVTRRKRSRELDVAEQEHTAAQAEDGAATRRLQDRSVEVFKYGAGREQQALVSGLIGAADWHEVAVGTTTDHVAPWQSVFKVTHLFDTDVDFVRKAKAERERRSRQL
jgi:septal ring factor EnvC (AmiA/AmiB activator)